MVLGLSGLVGFTSLHMLTSTLLQHAVLLLHSCCAQLHALDPTPELLLEDVLYVTVLLRCAGYPARPAGQAPAASPARQQLPAPSSVCGTQP